MSVEEVRHLLDLLKESPEVTELSLKGASGGKVVLKKLPGQTTRSLVLSNVDYEPATAEDVEFEVLEPSVSTTSIRATMVGLFHEVNPPLLTGATIVLGQIVGYIESMRLMNEIVSTVSGTVESVQISENQPVEYGQPLFLVSDAQPG